MITCTQMCIRDRNESDLGSLLIYLDHVYTLYTPAKLKSILLAIATERSYHPIRDYIESLPAWDGVPRVDTLFVDYLGAADTAYTRAVARKMLVAAIARVYQPGIKFDSVVAVSYTHLDVYKRQFPTQFGDGFPHSHEPIDFSCHTSVSMEYWGMMW